ncbi:MAG TPA: type II toxin-antitoxin system VapC family toxin [Mycobacteriales bacterium]|nr:type II toxin-antitoxin system VapC family toxin [Mycobacteriales bacterium]
MILVDTNLLLYAHVSDFEQHEAARRWLDGVLGGRSRVGLPWPALLGFVRLVTNPRVFPRPEPAADAWDQVTDWLDAAPAWIPVPTDRHAEVLGSLVPAVSGPNLWPDAHLAALAVEHGLTVMSTDGDFARYPGVRWENPLR